MICLKNISKSFSNSKSERIILEGINIEFNNKGLYLIKGESGSGKTTLLNMIIRDLKPDTGNIYIDGKDLEEFNNEELNYYRSNYISVLNQNNTLLTDLNLRDNLNLVLKISDIKLNDEYIKNTLKKFKLDEDILLSYPNDISGGELKRIQLILAILKDTKVIILDEPDSSLDLENQLIIKELIKEISNDKLVIVISHNVDLYNEIENKYLYEIKNKTINNNLNEIEDNKYEIKRTKNIPFKFICLLALKYTKRQLFKFIFSLIMLSVTLFITIVSFNFLLFNEINYYDLNHDNEYVIISDINDINKFTKEIDEKYINVYEYTDSIYYHNDNDDYYLGFGKKYATQKDIKDFNLNIIGNNINNDDEILISPDLLSEFEIDDFIEPFDVYFKLLNKNYKVVGVIDFNDHSFDNFIIFNDAINNVKANGIVLNNNGYDSLYNIVINNNLNIHDDLFNSLYGFNNNRNNIWYVLIIVLAAFIIFDVFIISNFLINSFVEKIEEMKKLTNLGLKRKNIIMLYITPLIILLIFSFIISGIIYKLSNDYVNKLISENIIINYMQFNYLTYLSLIIMIIIIVIISVIITFKIVEKKR